MIVLAVLNLVEGALLVLNWLAKRVLQRQVDAQRALETALIRAHNLRR